MREKLFKQREFIEEEKEKIKKGKEKEKQEEKEKETQEKQEKGLTQNSLLLLGWKRAINVRWFYWLISGYISRKKLVYLEAKINFNKTKTRYKTISKTWFRQEYTQKAKKHNK